MDYYLVSTLSVNRMCGHESRHPIYQETPELRTVIKQVTIDKIIEFNYLIPAVALYETGLTPALYNYIQENCQKAADLLAAVPGLYENFDILVAIVCEEFDEELRNRITAQASVCYDVVAFDHWAAPHVAAFLDLS